MKFIFKNKLINNVIVLVYFVSLRELNYMKMYSTIFKNTKTLSEIIG